MGERLYSCEVGCGYFARTRSALSRHIATRHGRGEGIKHKCCPIPYPFLNVRLFCAAHSLELRATIARAAVFISGHQYQLRTAAISSRRIAAAVAGFPPTTFSQ